MRFFTAIAGITFVYVVTNFFIEQRGDVIPLWLQEFNQHCFGVYVFQQFILQILYYKTTLPAVVGPYWLPWIGLIIALGASTILSWLLRRTQVGRMLI